MARILTTGVLGLDIGLGVTGFLLTLFLISWNKSIPKGLRLPPGPPGKPFIGNLTDMPLNHQWRTYAQWGKKYGDLMSVKVFGQHIVLVNSLEVAHDLFDGADGKDLLYADRGEFPMVKLIGHDWNFGLMPYGESWRRHRKAFHQHFNASVVPAYQDMQAKHARDLVRRLHGSPDNFIGHLRHLAGAIIMEIVYGIKVLPNNDPYIEIAEKVTIAVSEALKPGAFLVDTFPILKYLPEWIPGVRFKKMARAWRIPMTQMAVVPFMKVKECLNAGIAGPSVVASLLEDMGDRIDRHADDEQVIRNTAVTAYGAGADTTVSALTSFILAMVLYPEVQQKAQAELDSVLGMGRLPTFEDRQNLPYINALCSEILRWQPVTPLGIPHWVTQDDVYGNYFIPGGSIVIGNTWAMFRDENIFGAEPDKFRPERFLQPGVKEPTNAFGYGRRMCPGRFLLQNIIFIAVTHMLAVFNMSLARDDQGNEIAVEVSVTPGFISHPEPFRCSIKPRSASADKLISDCVVE